MKLNATIIVLFNSVMVLLIVLVNDTQCHLHHQLNGQLKTLFHKMFHNDGQQLAAAMMPPIKVKRNWIMPQIPVPIDSNSLLSKFEQPPFPLLPVFVQTQPQPVLVVGKMRSDLDAPPSQLYARPLPLYNIPYYKYARPNLPFNDYLPPTATATTKMPMKSVEVEDNRIESRTTPLSTITKQEKPELTITTVTPAIVTAGQEVDIEHEMGTSLEPDMSSQNQNNGNRMIMMEQVTNEPVITSDEDSKQTTTVPADLAATVTETETESVSTTVQPAVELEQHQNTATTLQHSEESIDSVQVTTTVVASHEEADEHVDASLTTESSLVDEPKTTTAVAAVAADEEEEEAATTPSQDQLGAVEEPRNESLPETIDNENVPAADDEADQQFAGYHYPKPVKAFDF